MSDDRKIELTVVKPTEEQESYVDLMAIWRALRKKKRLAAWLIIIGILAGFAVGVIGNLLFTEPEVQTLISFGFEGVENGKDPNGAVFDVTKISAPVVVQPAIEATGLTDKVTADKVRQAMRFEGVVPEDVLQRISIIRTIAEDNVSALSELQEISYNPTEFLISIDLNKAELDEADGQALLDAIITEYRSWFMNTYSYMETLSVVVGNVDYDTYDYLEVSDLLKVDLNTARRYVSSLQSKDATFRSVNTSYSFADLRSVLDSIYDIDLPKLNSLIMVNQLTKDKATMEAYYTYQIRNANNELNEALERLASVEAAIENYDKGSSIVYGEGGAMTTMTNDSEAYDALFRDLLSISEEVSQLRARVTELEQAYNDLNAFNSDLPGNTPPATEQTPGEIAGETTETQTGEEPVGQTAATAAYSYMAISPEEARATVEELIASIIGRLSVCVEQINATTEEYYETVVLSNAIKVEVPPQKDNGVELVALAQESVKLAIILAVVACVLVVAMATFTALVSGDLFVSPEDKRDRKKQQSDPSADSE